MEFKGSNTFHTKLKLRMKFNAYPPLTTGRQVSSNEELSPSRADAIKKCVTEKWKEVGYYLLNVYISVVILLNKLIHTGIEMQWNYE